MAVQRERAAMIDRYLTVILAASSTTAQIGRSGLRPQNPVCQNHWRISRAIVQTRPHRHDPANSTPGAIS
jgi:hypothetical protein